MEALRRNLSANHIDDERFTLLLGDNQQVPLRLFRCQKTTERVSIIQICPSGVADRCNLGLIPSSEASWPVACRALRPQGGRLHVHGVVNGKQETHEQWSERTRQRIETMMHEVHPHDGHYQCQIEHIERVKPYGPHLDHLVVDLLLTRVPRHSPGET